jgi:plasmid stability protein
VNLRIRNLPPRIETALRARAQTQRKTIEQVALEAMAIGLRQAAVGKKQRDLSDIAGTWVEDPIFEEVRKYHEQLED